MRTPKLGLRPNYSFMTAQTGGTLTLGRIKGIPIQFHFTIVFLLVYLIAGRLVDSESVLRNGLFIVGILGSVLLHELGHALTALRFGIGISSITMYPIGGVARLMAQPPPRQELWITLAGPAVNLALAIVAYAGLLTSSGGVKEYLREFIIVNIGLFVFNMIPAFPMDGGRLLRAGLALWIGEDQATRIAAMVGIVIAGMMAIYAIMNAQYILLFIAMMIYSGAQQERMIRNAHIQQLMK